VSQRRATLPDEVVQADSAPNFAAINITPLTDVPRRPIWVAAGWWRE
jgi:hypothetical protein